jgi:hypothetical protein
MTFGNRPIFGNKAKTVAKIAKFKLKIQTIYIKLLLNVKIVQQTLLWNFTFV